MNAKAALLVHLLILLASEIFRPFAPLIFRPSYGPTSTWSARKLIQVGDNKVAFVSLPVSKVSSLAVNVTGPCVNHSRQEYAVKKLPKQSSQNFVKASAGWAALGARMAMANG